MQMAVPTRQTLAVLVRNARRSRGMSQEDLAREVAVHKGTISNLERGLVDTEPDTLRRLETTLGLDLAPETLYRDGVVTMAVAELEKRFRTIEPEHRVTFVAQVIAYMAAWKPPAPRDKTVRNLSRERYERDIRAIPGISEEQVRHALGLFDTTMGP